MGSGWSEASSPRRAGQRGKWPRSFIAASGSDSRDHMGSGMAGVEGSMASSWGGGSNGKLFWAQGAHLGSGRGNEWRGEGEVCATRQRGGLGELRGKGAGKGRSASQSIVACGIGGVALGRRGKWPRGVHAKDEEGGGGASRGWPLAGFAALGIAGDVEAELCSTA